MKKTNKPVYAAEIHVDCWRTKTGRRFGGHIRAIVAYLMKHGKSRTDVIGEAVGMDAYSMKNAIKLLRFHEQIRVVDYEREDGNRLYGIWELVAPYSKEKLAEMDAAVLERDTRKERKMAKAAEVEREEVVHAAGCIATQLKGGGVMIQQGASRKFYLEDKRHVATDTIGRNKYFGHGGGTGTDCSVSWPSR